MKHIKKRKILLTEGPMKSNTKPDTDLKKPGILIPAMPSVCRPSVMQFAYAMEDRLRANDHKGGWEDLEQDYLVRRLLEEVGELVGAVMCKTRNCSGFAQKVEHEAADVANFAMMIAENARRGK